MKICSRCQIHKEDHEFSKSKVDKDRLHSWCRGCQNAANKVWRQEHPEQVKVNRQKYAPKQMDYVRRARYGVTSTDYQWMLDKQQGLCAICRRSSTKQLAVDHDHRTKKVRGLLCNSCNRALGLLKDDVDVIVAAATYLLNGKDK